MTLASAAHNKADINSRTAACMYFSAVAILFRGREFSGIKSRDNPILGYEPPHA